VVDGFADYQAHIDSFNLGYLLGFDDGLPVWKSLRLRAAVKRVHKVVNTVIDAQLGGHGEHQTMLELLARRQERNPAASIGRDALRNESATLFMAGYETTATALAWAWYLLAKAPWAEAKLHEEIARVCGDRPVEAEDAPRLDYARSIIEETLRLYPPVPILSRQAKSAITVGGVEVEKAGLIVVSPWTLHRCPDLWPEPERFRPERFMGERPKPYTYIPFAVGPRICPGMNFGLTEAVLALAVLAQRFQPRLAPGHVVETRCRLTLRPHDLRMQLRPREAA
jgi:cytochrome P450